MTDERSDTPRPADLWPPVNWVIFESASDGQRVAEEARAVWTASGTVPRVYSARGSVSQRFRDRLFGGRR